MHTLVTFKSRREELIMKIHVITAIVFGLFVSLFTGTYAHTLDKNVPIQRTKKPRKIIINVSPEQLGVNCPLTINWSFYPNTYRTLYLQVCNAHGTSCGGTFPVQNKNQIWNSFRYKPDESMLNKNWIIKISTRDKNFMGISRKFFVNGMLPYCQ